MKTWKTKSCLLINYNHLGIQATRQSKTSFRQNDLIHFICTVYCLYIVQHTKHMVQDIHAFKLNNKKSEINIENTLYIHFSNDYSFNLESG